MENVCVGVGDIGESTWWVGCLWRGSHACYTM